MALNEFCALAFTFKRVHCYDDLKVYADYVVFQKSLAVSLVIAAKTNPGHNSQHPVYRLTINESVSRPSRSGLGSVLCVNARPSRVWPLRYVTDQAAM